MLINSSVTLVNEHARLSPPLDLAYIASALMEAGYRAGAIDFNVNGLNLKRIDSMLSLDHPKIVGVSTTTETYGNALRIARRVKENAPLAAHLRTDVAPDQYLVGIRMHRMAGSGARYIYSFGEAARFLYLDSEEALETTRAAARTSDTSTRRRSSAGSPECSATRNSWLPSKPIRRV